MEINSKTFNEWMKKNYGIQDQYNYQGTQTEEICLKFAQEVAENTVVRQRLNDYIDSRINYFSGGDEMKSMNESLRDEIFVKELKSMKETINRIKK